MHKACPRCGNSREACLQASEELVCILVLPQVQRRAVVVSECVPEAPGYAPPMVANCQLSKHFLQVADEVNNSSAGRRHGAASADAFCMGSGVQTCYHSLTPQGGEVTRIHEQHFLQGPGRRRPSAPPARDGQRVCTSPMRVVQTANTVVSKPYASPHIDSKPDALPGTEGRGSLQVGQWGGPQLAQPEAAS